MPASGYCEWKHTPGVKQPQPWYFTRADGQPITFAAIHDKWNDRETKEKFRSVSMVITEPNKFVAEVHDRMPVILDERAAEDWMNPKESEPRRLKSFLSPAAEERLVITPASPLVNSVKNDGPELLDNRCHASSE